MTNIVTDLQRRLATEKLLGGDTERHFCRGLGNDEDIGRAYGGVVSLVSDNDFGVGGGRPMGAVGEQSKLCRLGRLSTTK